MPSLIDCLFIRQSDEHVPGEPFGFYSPEWSDAGRTVTHCLSHHLLWLHSQWAAGCCLYAALNKWFTINHYCSVVGSWFVIFLLCTQKLSAMHSSHICQSNSTQDIQLKQTNNYIVHVWKMYVLMQVYSEYIKCSILCMLTVMNEWCVCLCCVILSWQISKTGRTTDLTDTWLAK